MKKFLPFILLLLAVAACGGQQAVVRKDSKASAADMVPADTKDSEIPAGKYKDMYSVLNNVFIYLSPDANGSISSNDQIMKYDRVRMFEVRGDWARISLSASLPERSRRQTGWVARSSLDEWVTAKFFNVKDNVFNSTKPVLLYGNSKDARKAKEEGETNMGFASLDLKEPYRVLKGDGNGFYIVSKSGKEGWVALGEVPSEKLVAKEFVYKTIESNSYFYPVKKDDKAQAFQLANNNQIKYYLENKQDKVVYISSFITNTRKNAIIYNNGVYIDLLNKIGSYPYTEEFVKINGNDYYYWGYIASTTSGSVDFFGFIVKYVIYNPKDYVDQMEAILKKKKSEYVSYTEEIAKISEKQTQKVKLTFFTRDSRMEKIKEVEFEGNFDFSATHFYFNADYGGFINSKPVVRKTKEGDVEIILNLMGGVIDARKFAFEYDNGEQIFVNYNREFENVPKTVRLKPYPVKILLTKDEMRKAGMDVDHLDRFVKFTSPEMEKENRERSTRKNNRIDAFKSELMKRFTFTENGKNYKHSDLKSGYKIYDVKQIEEGNCYYIELLYNNIKGKMASKYLILNSNLEVIGQLNNVDIFDLIVDKDLFLYKNAKSNSISINHLIGVESVY